LSGGRTVSVMPEASSPEKETAFCRFSERHRTVISVRSEGQGGPRSTRVVTERPLTIGQIRERMGEPESPVHVQVGPPCGAYDGPLEMNQPGDLFAVPSRSVVTFVETKIDAEVTMTLD
jgi:hypothetical protein